MAIDTSWLSTVMPIWAFVLVFVLVFAILQKTKILGANKWIDSIVGIIMGIIFITFSSVREYLTNVTPWFVVLLTVSFFLFLLIAFLLKSDAWSKFTKPSTIIVIILLAIILIAAIFYTFPSTRALLPGNNNHDSDSCNYEVRGYDYYSYKDCYKRDNDNSWRCDNGNNRYRTYDGCYKSDGRYRCYDYDSDSCNTDSNNEGSDVFEKAADWFYRDKITNAFWLIVVGIIAAFIVTRGK